MQIKINAEQQCKTVFAIVGVQSEILVSIIERT
jgi:hypothetical protein